MNVEPRKIDALYGIQQAIDLVLETPLKEDTESKELLIYSLTQALKCVLDSIE